MASKKTWIETRAEYALAATLLATLRFLPLPIANRVARAATMLLDVAVPKLRRVGVTNLAFAMPELDPKQRHQVIDGVFRGVARLLVTLARFPSLKRENISEWISCEGLQHYLDAKRDGKGVLIATAHLGNWELSAFAHALMTEPMNVMVRSLDNPLIDAIVESRRTLSGNRLIYKKDAARSVLKALHDNQAVGILIDQNAVLAEGAFIDFFGKSACAGVAFVKLAYHSGAPVVPGFALWDAARERYVLCFYPKVELSGDAIADTQRIHTFFEQVIRNHPDQWMWIHRRWKTRPPAEPPLY